MVRMAEFFAGMGLVRAGLEPLGIQTVFAHDIDQIKARLYRDNWGWGELCLGDIRHLKGSEVPCCDLATASFPCTDLSLAGKRKGLRGKHSSVVMDFLRVLFEMGGRAPRTVMMENVPGFLTSNLGKDLQEVVRGLEDLGYGVDHIVVDAATFVPQSRRRVFLLAHKGKLHLPISPCVHRQGTLCSVAYDGGAWWCEERLQKFLSSLSSLHRERLNSFIVDQRVRFLGAYRRTRSGEAVWEVRFDELAGALRAVRGGSSRQALVKVGLGKVAVRWMSVLEYARLQGAGHLKYDSVSEVQALFALGDGVCVPVIDWLGRNSLLSLVCEHDHKRA